jgi:hypothetical protein
VQIKLVKLIVEGRNRNEIEEALLDVIKQLRKGEIEGEAESDALTLPYLSDEVARAWRGKPFVRLSGQEVMTFVKWRLE